MLTVRYYAAARAAAGVSEEKLTPEQAPTLGALRADLAARHGERLATILGVASFLVDGTSQRNLDAPLPADATVDVLPPFAGG